MIMITNIKMYFYPAYGSVFTYSISYIPWIVHYSKQVLIICLIYLNTYSAFHIIHTIFS